MVTTSGKQVLGAITFSKGIEILPPTLPASFATYRTMRKDPVIAIARAFSIAPVVSASWSVSASSDAPSDAADFIREHLLPLREWIVIKALEGGIDFGWAAIEKNLINRGNFRVWKLKQLLQDLTIILIDSETGEFRGFRQMNPIQVDIPLEQSLLFSFRTEGDMLYGSPLLENCRAAYNDWRTASAGAERYDKKIAGSHWIVRYPPGKTIIGNEEKENSIIAEEILDSLQSSGGLVMPNIIAAAVNGMNAEFNEEMRWKIELLSDQGARQVSFVPRLEYLDKLKVRGLIFGERAIMEGQHGTKAEAGVHVELAMLHREREHEEITAVVNQALVDPLLEINFGPGLEGKVKLKPAPLVDSRRAYLEEVYTTILRNPIGFDAEMQNVGLDELKERLGVPISVDDETGRVATIQDADDETGINVDDETGN